MKTDGVETSICRDVPSDVAKGGVNGESVVLSPRSVQFANPVVAVRVVVSWFEVIRLVVGEVDFASRGTLGIASTWNGFDHPLTTAGSRGRGGCSWNRLEDPLTVGSGGCSWNRLKNPLAVAGSRSWRWNWLEHPLTGIASRSAHRRLSCWLTRDDRGTSWDLLQDGLAQFDEPSLVLVAMRELAA